VQCVVRPSPSCLQAGTPDDMPGFLPASDVSAAAVAAASMAPSNDSGSDSSDTAAASINTRRRHLLRKAGAGLRRGRGAPQHRRSLRGVVGMDEREPDVTPTFPNTAVFRIVFGSQGPSAACTAFLVRPAVLMTAGALALPCPAQLSPRFLLAGWPALKLGQAELKAMLKRVIGTGARACVLGFCGSLKPYDLEQRGLATCCVRNAGHCVFDRTGKFFYNAAVYQVRLGQMTGV
jgi:hypothetical protein